MNYITTQPGASYGLRLVLWVNQSDSLLIQSPGAGYRVDLSLVIIFPLFEFRLLQPHDEVHTRA